MKNKFVVVVLTTSAFIVSFLLASYFSGNLLNLSADFKTFLQFKDEQDIGIAKAVEQHKVQMKDVQLANVVHIKQKVTNAGCQDISLGKLAFKKTNNIYTWVDEEGISHFSDQLPEDGDYHALNYAGGQVFDYFNLNLFTDNLPYDFRQNLTSKLNKLFYFYGSLLDKASLKKIDINIRIFHTSVDFNRYKKVNHINVSSDTPGFYVSAKNEAAILYLQPKQTMKTAVHEATHAINRGIIGFTPQWLNEGLAEYVEEMKVESQIGIIKGNASWVKNGYVKEEMLPLSVMMSANYQQWNAGLRKNLYATSWAFIHFIMENKQRKTMLAKMIKLEQKNLCNTLSQAQIEKAMAVSVDVLQQQFTLWTQLSIKAHRI